MNCAPTNSWRLLLLTAILYRNSLCQTASHLPPAVLRPDPPGQLDLNGKWHYYLKSTFNPGLFFGSVFPAAFVMISPPKRYSREWRQGAAAYARNVGDAALFQTTLYTGKFVAGAALGEDPRYFPSHSQNIAARVGHALAFTLIDRSDNGRNRLALSNFAGAAAAGFVGQAYLPDSFNDTTHAGQRALIGFGFFAADNLFREFSPELKTLGQKLHLVKRK